MCYWFKHPSRNLYETKHGWTRERMSYCLKDNTAELESYNKAFQEPSGTVLSRFEVRTKSKTRTLDTFPLDSRPRAYIKTWQKELKDCATLLDSMVQAQNDVLMDEYRRERQSTSIPARWTLQSIMWSTSSRRGSLMTSLPRWALKIQQRQGTILSRDILTEKRYLSSKKT